MYLGVDLHGRYTQVAVMDLKDETAERVRVENANLDDLAQRYAGSRAVIEATNNYYYVYDTLAGYLDITVTHPNKLTLIARSDEKTDRVDVKGLARLLRPNSVPQGCVPTDEIREAHTLMHERQILVENRTKFASEIHGLLVDNGITQTVKLLSVEGREFLRELSLPPLWGSLLDSYLGVVGTLIEQMTQLETVVGKRAGSLEEIQLLMTIPSVNYYSTLLVYAELSEADRFDGHKGVVSYMGLNPTIRGSGDPRIEGGTSRRGSGRVRWILVQNAYSAVYACEGAYLSTFFHRLNRQTNPKKTIVIAARKLFVSMYYVLIQEEVYDPPGVSTRRRESGERRTDIPQ